MRGAFYVYEKKHFDDLTKLGNNVALEAKKRWRVRWLDYGQVFMSHQAT